MSEEKRIAIQVDHVDKSFKLPHEKVTSIKSAFVNVFSQKRSFENQHVLKDISFKVHEGEFIGIVGRNGSGKSTLLKLLAGIYAPDKGHIAINGKLTPFIELGVGFSPELTGRENVFLNGALLGFSRKEMALLYDEIVEFAELEKFMDQKLKNYSSGMQVRLAFSIAIRARSDILLLDEVLAVGDANFQAKCFEYFRTLRKQNKTVIFISHDKGAVLEFCSRAILIDKGVIRAEGDTRTVLKEYDNLNVERLEEQKDRSSNKTTDNGEKIVVIESCKVMKSGKAAKAFAPNDNITVRLKAKFNERVDKPVYGLVINRQGEPPIFATNTQVENIATKNMKKGDTAEVSISFKNLLGNGRYSVAPAVASSDTHTMYVWQDDMVGFSVTGWEDSFRPVFLDHSIEVKEN